MVAFADRTGDFTKKKHLYKFYKNGYTSRKPKYITAGQYLGYTGGIVSGSYGGSAFIGGSLTENTMVVSGNGDSNLGLSAGYRVESDARRKFDIDGFNITFAHSYFQNNLAVVNTYEIQLFDYILRWTASGNTLKVFYKTTELVSVTMSSSYLYIRMRELNGVFYIDRSADGITWTAWTNRTINRTTDLLRTVMALQATLGAGGNGVASASAYNIEATDRRGNLLAIETQVLSDLEYNESINNPASSTTLVLPYSPLNVPAHCDIGNFVEVYTNFYDDGVIQYEGILDHNGAPILDENNLAISGVVLHGNVPENSSIQKFSGYIDSIDYDYDYQTIALVLVSHGEIMANSMVRDGNVDVNILSNDVSNNIAASTLMRQTFTVPKMTKLDAVKLRLQYGAGGQSSVIIGRGNTTLMGSNTMSWSGGLPLADYTFRLNQSLYLEPGVTYWIYETGGVNWRYNDADISTYTNGKRQWNYTVGAGAPAWTDVPGVAYFFLYTSQLQLAVNLSGKSPAITQSIFDKSLNLDYSPVYIESVEDAGYDINIALNMDTAKNAVASLYRQLPSGWFYHVDVGTGALRIKNKNSTPDHLLVFGRDFTEMKVTKDIDGIINDVYYVGGVIVENGPKLTVRATDIDSMANYRQGLVIIANDKVTRYDTAQLLAENTIDNNNASRITTEITVSAAVYNTETIRGGDVVKIVNGDQDVLGTTLVVATIKYNPGSVTLSLDSAPRNLSRTIDAINRQLENIQTANAGSVL